MWRRVRIIIIITPSINSFSIRNVEPNNTPININTFSKPHRMELKITPSTSTTCNITGIDVNQSTLNLFKDSWLRNKEKTTNMISRLCIRKIIWIALRQKENISIDQWSFKLRPILTLRYTRDQLITHLKIEAYREILILKGWRGVYPNLVIAFSIKPSVWEIGYKIG